MHAKVVEGNRERIQVFEGVVIRRRAGGINENFTVRRIASHGIGVERTFLLHSPRIDRIEVVRRGKVRRAKLYYLRGRTGRAARIKERRIFPARGMSAGPATRLQAAPRSRSQRRRSRRQLLRSMRSPTWGPPRPTSSITPRMTALTKPGEHSPASSFLLSFTL